ncbi:MAG: sugar phosphate isomerase/epimerase [Firmicutes bacterium]|nr:sugar phosphate isomerase/epimerase [Bacillota bacterium]
MKNIGIYVNNWIFGNCSLSEVAARVARIGFDGIELVGEPEIYRVDEVNKIMGDLGLRVQSICGMHPGPDPSDLRALCHPDAAERAKAVDYVKACVDLACGVGGRSVLVVPGLVGQPAYFVSREEDWRRAVEALASAAAYAEQAGILLTIEPINRYEVGVVYSIGDAIRMAKEINSPAIRTMGDTFHMQIEEGDGIPAAIRRAGRYWLQHLHVADNTREAPGMGTMPWREILRSLMEIDYEGGISCEPLPRGASPYDARQGRIPAEKLDAELAYGLRFLREEAKIAGRFLN